ncbi:TIGR03751 family conjugal transfer lipoprotein [Pseudomonas putida]|uniref:TIGR03751 family conjugal transfer lipoprotein n=1 Tax=Pseudomonas putida TaxID=303 RepID=UPI0023647FB2|nr:TIGR03751 family conjugal transfer lipoprotein [Pseudomonas putida]MDD2052773.1 TIGR03751 family conjugal transfer lipoprotein [Pseudomonas putida]
MKALNPLGWILISTALITACSTDKDRLLPHGDQSMLDLWRNNGSGTQREWLDARASLRRPLDSHSRSASFEQNRAYSRTAANEIHNLFPRLPNPDLVMYVFPHLAGTEPVPVPGYSTVFPFYSQTHYAMPGERTDDY